MSRMTLTIMLCAVSGVAILLGGCGKARQAVESARAVGEAAKVARDMQDGEATIKTEEGEVKIEADKEGKQMTMTFTDDEGQEITVTGGESIDLSGLDIAVYPGAEQVGASTVSAADGERTTVALSTGDSFAAVAKFYKGKYPDAQKREMTMGGQKYLMLTISDSPNGRSVNVAQGEGADEVNITLLQHQSQE